MKCSFKNILTSLLLFFILFAFIPVYSTSSDNNANGQNTHITDYNAYTTLNENWQYHIGDLLAESLSLSPESPEYNLKWNNIENISSYIQRPKNCNTVWLRIKIPEAGWLSPAIYFEEIYGESISVYINGRFIFDNRNLHSNTDKNSFIVPLIPDDYGHYLYIRISLDLYHRFGPVKNVYFGDYKKISSLFSKKGYVSEVIGFSLIFLGIVLLIAAFLIVGLSKKIVISLCPVLICMGLVYIVQFSNFIEKFPEFDWVYDGYFSILVLGSLFSITYFYKQIFGEGYKKIINISLKINIIVLFIMFLHKIDVIILGYHPYVYLLGGWSLISMIILVATAIYNSYKGNTDAKIFMAGLFGFAGILIAEMFVFLFYSNNYRFLLFQWGILIFIFSQIIILARKITSLHNKTILYSKRLEKKNAQLDLMWNEVKKSRDRLAELNKTLEDKVLERTRQLKEANTELTLLNEELHASNIELIETLEKLKSTQEQLIKSEKMAALGQLVSGIAHELNTPLGAIQASINNMEGYIENIINSLSGFLTVATPEKIQMLLFLIKNSKNNNIYISTKDERKHKRAILKELNQLGIKNAHKLAEQLTSLGISDYKPYIKILENPELHVIVEVAYLVTNLKNSSHTISLAADKTSKVVFALKSYSHQSNSTDKEDTDVIQTIETVLTIYNNKIKPEVEVVKNYSDIPKIKSNADELTQVWTNIIHNALQAMEYKGVLTIDTTVKDNCIVVSITDSGPGIPDGIKDKIFQPFFTTKPLGEGTGLGLDIVARIINNHNGKIEVSTEPGKTTFSVYIPINKTLDDKSTG